MMRRKGEGIVFLYATDVDGAFLQQQQQQQQSPRILLQRAIRSMVRKIFIAIVWVYACSCCNCYCYGGSGFLFVGAIKCNISLGELDALEALYDSTNGADWSWRTANNNNNEIDNDNNNNIYDPPSMLPDSRHHQPPTLTKPQPLVKLRPWKFPASVSGPCTNNWKGISCSKKSISLSSPCYIESLLLSNYNLQGSLPSNISTLTGLSLLDLSSNSLTSSIPSHISVLTGLLYLNLQHNFLSGSIISQISALTGLSTLSFLDNVLTNSIPTELYSLTGLTFLSLSKNLLTGNISCAISSLTKLSVLSLSFNHFSGSICSNISHLTSLTELHLDYNFLSGSIPTELFSLNNLIFLSLFNNYFTGSIGSNISHLTSLTKLYLSTNHLSGSIPSEISALSSLTILELEVNHLTGSIPNQLTAMTSLNYLQLDNNFLTGTIPSEMGNLASLGILQLNNNKLVGCIPSSFSALTKVSLLFLQDNELTSSIPFNLFSHFTSLNVLDISNNRFVGLLPASLSELKSTLVYFASSNNNFTGDPFFFLGFPSITLVNVSYNSFDDISRWSSSSPNQYNSNYSCPALNYLDVSNNYLIGSLPDSLGTVFHNLTLLSASNNALMSYIPNSLCNVKNLTTLLLNDLGNRSLLFTFQNSDKRYTIPSCLLSLPRLETAHLVSNALYGTLGEIGSNMVSLSLVGNLLTGTIPKSIQRSSSKLNNLQLSINRLSGTLVSEAFNELTNNSKIDFYSNRISGNIPRSITRFVAGDKPNILTGNVFNCTGKASKALVDYETYSCGSSSINFYSFVYIAAGVALVLCIAMFMSWIRRRRANKSNNTSSNNINIDSSSSSSSNSSSNRNVQSDNNALALFIIYFQHRPFPTALFRGLCSSQFLVASSAVALFTTLFNVGYSASYDNDADLSFQNTFSTVFNRYGWTSTFIYVHGVLPFLLVVLGLSTLLFVHLFWFDGVSNIAKNETVGGESISSSIITPGKEQVGDIGDEEGATIFNPSQPPLPSYWLVLTSYLRNKYTSFSLFSIVDNPINRWMLGLQLVNVAAVTCVNVIYIEGVNSKNIDILYKKFIPIALSIFKILWVNIFIVYMAKYGIRSKLSLHVVFLNYMFALVYLDILVPIITVYFTDHDCFYYPLFSQIDPIIEKYPSTVPSVPHCFCVNDVCSEYTCPIVFNSTMLSQSITPTWTYNYQCGASILTNYIPAVLSAYTIKGVILPILKLFLLSFPPSSRVRNWFVVKTSFLPYTMNAMSEEELGRDEDREFRTFEYLSNIVTDLLMLLTYGILCPFLTFLVLWSIVVNEIIDHIQIGSYVYDMSRTISIRFKKGDILDLDKMEEAPHAKSKAQTQDADIVMHIGELRSRPDLKISKSGSAKGEQIEFQFDLASRIYLDNSHELLMFVWRPMIIVILLFMVVILFDMIADIYYSITGLVCVLLFCSFIYLLFGTGKAGLDRILSCLKWTRTRTRTCAKILYCNNREENSSDGSKDRRNRNSDAATVGVEMKTIQENPIHT